MGRGSIGIAACCLALLIGAGAAAADLIYSPDVRADLSGTDVADEDAVVDDLAGNVTLIDLGPLPGNVEVDAVELLSNGDRLFSLDVAAEPSEGLTVLPGDVVRYDGVGYSIEFAAVAEGLPASTNVDAVGTMASATCSCPSIRAWIWATDWSPTTRTRSSSTARRSPRASTARARGWLRSSTSMRSG